MTAENRSSFGNTGGDELQKGLSVHGRPDVVGLDKIIIGSNGRVIDASFKNPRRSTEGRGTKRGRKNPNQGRR